MANRLKVAFIGGGIMAEAIMAGILNRSVATPDAISVGEPLEQRRQYLETTYGVSASGDNVSTAKDADLVVLAVKPQQLSAVLEEMSGRLTESQTALSIVAGASVRQISLGLGHAAVIRVMPNTPAQVGQGMTVWTTSSSVSDAQRETAREVLATLGEEMFVADEKYLDMATALSASGPAYVFLFLEAMIDAGVYLGLPRDMAGTLALQTFLGSATLAKQSGKHPAELRNMVTSPGGTTAEALLSMEEDGLRSTIINAVIAAHEKATTLGEED